MSAEIETLHVPFAKFLREKRLEFINARSDRESTIEAGWPDFTVLHPRRPALLIEFKDKETRTSKRQSEVHARLSVIGHAVHIVRDIGVAFNLVNAWLSDVRHEPAQNQMQRPYIAQNGQNGDWIHDANGKPIRRATVADLSEYERKR